MSRRDRRSSVRRRRYAAMSLGCPAGRELPRARRRLPKANAGPSRGWSTGSASARYAMQASSAVAGVGITREPPDLERKPSVPVETFPGPFGAPARSAGSQEPSSRPRRAPIMHNTETKSILKSLIEGRDPGSGDQLPPECVVHRPAVLRALLAGFDALDQTSARAQRRAQLPGNVGNAWTTEEESRLASAFKSGESPADLARKHERTLRAIEARLEKLGLITAEQRTTRGGFMG